MAQECPHCHAELSAENPFGGVIRCLRCRALVLRADASTATAEPVVASPTSHDRTTVSGAAPRPERPAPGPPIRVTLRIESGKSTGSLLTAVGREIVIGRRTGDIPLDDNQVSHHHVILQSLGSRYLARDLSSTNGTFVDGLRVGEAFVVPGQRLAVGGTTLEIVELHGANPPGRS